jgi:Kae1-associated kinase Bud32
MVNFHKKGAEAELVQSEYNSKKVLIKKRIPKGYRDKLLDQKIRKKRTRSEAKIIRALAQVIRVPEIFLVDEKKCEIVMEFVEGKMLKEIIENMPKLAILAGKEIKKIHALDIIHGDLTTSNILYNKKELCFIDFGLGYFSKKLEDKATDLIVFKKTFNATHSTLAKGWELVMKGYAPSEELLDRMKVIEKRARYH